jgi:predicted component of type VI protein secretion system
MPFLDLEGRPDLEGNPRQLSGELIIGSGSQATWRITGKELGARHFRVRVDGDGAATLAPVSPQNVVVLNGRQISPGGIALKSGDVVAAGSARFFYLDHRSSKRPAPAAPAGEAHLVNAATNEAYPLSKRVVQIGPEVGCSIVLKDPTVSRFHADIRSEGGGYAIYSMGSSGTKVNGQVVTIPRMLEDGDQIAMGETLFTFSRGPLPAEITPAALEGHDDALSRRSTQLAQRAVTVPIGSRPSRRRRRVPAMPLVVGGAVVLWCIGFYFATRK